MAGHDKVEAPRQPLLYTAEQAAELLQVSPSWLRKKASARAVPCTFVGKHLRFSSADIDAIVAAGAQAPHVPRPRRPTRRPEPAA